MIDTTQIYLLKLGGSLLTEKDTPFSLRKDIIDKAITQIIESKKKLIVIHGGGSFGHPLAKKYDISKGINPSVDDQTLGLAETHDAMIKLNSYIVQAFLKRGHPTISIQPSSIFIKDSQNITQSCLDTVEVILDMNLMPILYGDIVFHRDGNFSILSGDEIALELCKNLKKYAIRRVIFTMEVDGIYLVDSDGNNVLAKTLYSDELGDIKLANIKSKIDVTGSITGKLEEIKGVCEYGIPIQLINGLKEDAILKALSGDDSIGTNIIKKNNPTIRFTNEVNLGQNFSKGYLRDDSIESRKLEHIKIPLEYDVQHRTNYFDDVELIHQALPEISFLDIDLSVPFFGKHVSAPICISAITGGHPISKAINEILARAAESEKIIMSVGSQRAGLIDQEGYDTFSVVRQVAPSIPIIGNIGIGQLSSQHFDMEDFKRCVEMIRADVIAIHFNALHELMQDEGDISFDFFYENFKELRKTFSIPIIAKEVGSGISGNLARKLDSIGFDGFDVGGAGGTSFAAIEAKRTKTQSSFSRLPADTFREWGIPTPVSILKVRDVTQKPIIATGGLRNGVDIAKAIMLGADIGGFAFKFLRTSWSDLNKNTSENSIKEIRTLKNELQSSLWLTQHKNIAAAKENRSTYVILGKLFQWLNQ